MAKNKKPMWPIWLTVALVTCIAAVTIADWERYPTQQEMERYLTASHGDVEKVEVLSMKEESDAYEESLVYNLKYFYRNGKTSEEVFTIRKEDRKAVYPWHDYYQDMYPKIDKN